MSQPHGELPCESRLATMGVRPTGSLWSPGPPRPGGYPDSMDEYSWGDDASAVDFGELSELYRIAPLGIKPPDALATVFGHSMFACFVYAGDVLAGAGRALADGLDCAYIADVAVHPDHQGRG